MIKRFVITILIFGTLACANIFYYTQLDVKLDESLFTHLGSRTKNFQYFVLFRNEQQTGIIIKGWLFHGGNSDVEKIFQISFESDDATYTVSIPGVNQGIYSYLLAHLFVVPSDVLSVSLDGEELISFKDQRI